jgi:hypothetical protein
MISRKTILIDLDGVLNTYNGEYDSKFIPPIRKGAFEFIETLSKNYTLKIFTTREKPLVRKWIYDNNLEKYISEISNTKEPAWLIIDDRCITFRGDYNQALKSIEAFDIWYKE